MKKIVTGTVRVVGSEPFGKVVLMLPRVEGARIRQVLVLGPLEKTLRKDYQGKKVTLEGTDCKPGRPGFPDCITPTQIIPE